MDMKTAVLTADKLLNKSLADIKAAKESGDVDALFKAARSGAKPAMIVHKAAAIIKNPERYEGTEKRFKAEADSIVTLSESDDVMAKADAISRFNSAKRRYSAVRNVEKLIESL